MSGGSYPSKVRDCPGVPKSMDQAGMGVGYTLASGRLFCDISVFHEYMEYLMARPIMTHEFADEKLWDEMRHRYETLVKELGRVSV